MGGGLRLQGEPTASLGKWLARAGGPITNKEQYLRSWLACRTGVGHVSRLHLSLQGWGNVRLGRNQPECPCRK